MVTFLSAIYLYIVTTTNIKTLRFERFVSCFISLIILCQFTLIEFSGKILRLHNQLLVLLFVKVIWRKVKLLTVFHYQVLHVGTWITDVSDSAWNMLGFYHSGVGGELLIPPQWWWWWVPFQKPNHFLEISSRCHPVLVAVKLNEIFETAAKNWKYFVSNFAMIYW